MLPSPLTNALFGRLVTKRLPTGWEHTVLLSFDDGPTPGATEGVLARLEAHGARALFCLLGRKVVKAPDLVRAIADGGHALGNHTHDHDMGRLPAPAAYFQDMRRCSEAVAAAAGRAPGYFRAPGGRLHPASLWGPARLGMRHVLWSCDSEDWRCTERDRATDLGRRVAERVQGGDIVLLHDYDDTVIHALLDELLPRLRDRGFDLAGGPAALEGRGVS